MSEFKTPLVMMKVGGSLLDWNELPRRLAEVIRSRSTARLVLICGSGRVVDWVRDMDERHGLGEERSHELALRALDLSCCLLAELVPCLGIVTNLAELPAVWQSSRIPLLSPRPVLDAGDWSDRPLPHSWRLTSDSIAARLAERLGATELVLVKSASLSGQISRVDAARRGLVDRAIAP